MEDNIFVHCTCGQQPTVLEVPRPGIDIKPAAIFSTVCYDT